MIKNNEKLKRELIKTFSIINSENEYMEVRILKTTTGTLSGYFNNALDIFNAISRYAGKYNIFFTMNEVSPEIISRSKDHFTKYAKNTTTDSEIRRRKWILLDFDPVRPAGISSSEEELKSAKSCAMKVRKYLSEEGFPAPVFALSGNGYHLLYSCDLDNGEKERETIKKFLEVLDQKFSNEKVKVDRANFNAARICKLYGTVSCKGDDTEKRPHRRSRIIKAPDVIKQVRLEQLQELIAKMAPDNDQKKVSNRDNKGYQWKHIPVKDFLIEHGLEIAREKEYQGGICYVLKSCPFNPDHTDTGAYVIEYPNGKICAGCHHDSCSDKGWKELLKLYPDSRMLPPKRKRSETEEENAVDTLLKDIEEEHHIFYHDRAESPYVCVAKDGIIQYMEVYGSGYRNYIRYLFYERYQKAVPKDALQRVLDTLAVKAQIEGKEITPAYRCAYHAGKIYYYLADREQTVICIDENGYRVIAESPVPFIKKQNMLEQVLPKRSKDSLKKMGMKYWQFATADDRILHWILLISRFIAEGSQPLVYYFGDRGSAKSTSMRLDKMIVDPSEIDIKALPKSISDAVAAVSNQYMVSFDNVSRISDELSDIFCIVATHGYYSKKMLYSNNQEFAIKLNARVSFSGITNLSTKPDLIDRMVCLKLNRIDSSNRRTEEEIMKEFQTDLPYILDKIFRILSKAIPIYNDLKLERLPRMADFAKWGYAIAEALGYGGERFLRIYENNQADLLENLVSEDSLITVLIEAMKKQNYFKGTVTELLVSLTNMAEKMEIDTRVGWARDASSLSRKLYENQSVLCMFGISVNRGKSNGERYIELIMEDDDSHPEE